MAGRKARTSRSRFCGERVKTKVENKRRRARRWEATLWGEGCKFSSSGGKETNLAAAAK